MADCASVRFIRATRLPSVAAIPPSAFYSDDHIPLAANVARFCFCKTEQTLTDAVERLRARLPAYLNPL